ncbi:MAG: helix-turn-helix domain-containing protein [Actinomycetia bacterium]|nr:helix-turn-helix domain-containing protein [Actinomycetes bacterium]
MEESTQGRSYDAVRDAYPPMLNTAQVAELLDLNPRTVLAMAGDGRLPASRLPGGRKFHFLLEDILSTLAANRVSPSADSGLNVEDPASVDTD